MSLRQARDEAVNLLMGGKETVSSVLTFTSYLLGKHIHVQRQAAAEVRQVCNGRALVAGDVSHLPLVCSIIKEARRLYPPVSLISREAVRTVDIAGYRIRRFSQVHLSVYSIHRDARWFDRPDEFDPSRFLPGREKDLRRYAYLPFGAGPRRCVGRFAGFQQCVLAMACLLRDYQLRLAPGQGEPRLTNDIVLHPAEPLRMILDEGATGDVP
jgi:cytochrome P450